MEQESESLKNSRSGSDTSNSTKFSRNKDVKTYVVSVPLGQKSPVVKHGSLKILPIEGDLDDLHEIIREVEGHVTNVINKEVNILCSSCCTGFKIGRIKFGCLSKNKAKVEAKNNNVKASVI